MTFDEIIEIYRLTYFYQMLQIYYDRLGRWLPDRANVEMLRVQDRLFDMLNDGLDKMIRVYDMWLTTHHDIIVDELAETIRDVIQYAESSAWNITHWLDYENILNDLIEEMHKYGVVITDEEKKNILDTVAKFTHKGKYEKARKAFSDFLWEDLYAWLDEHDLAEKIIIKDKAYQEISDQKDELEEALYGRTPGYPEPRAPDLDNMIIQFHIGLHIAHHNGEMAEHLLRNETGTIDLLGKLSSGFFVPRWDRQLAKIIGNRYDPEVEDSQFIDWSERGRIRNPEAIPAPEFHIFIRE